MIYAKPVSYPSIISKADVKDICQEHDIPMIDEYEDGIKVGEYCPKCYAESLREFDGD